MRFLVVDDSTTMRRIIVTILKRLGHDAVLEAGDGREALARIKDGNVDIVITDWNMPEMTGLEFVRAIRTSPASSQIPVLMVTTNASKTDIVEALRAGVTSYVVKPFTPDTLKEKIEAVAAASAR